MEVDLEARVREAAGAAGLGCEAAGLVREVAGMMRRGGTAGVPGLAEAAGLLPPHIGTSLAGRRAVHRFLLMLSRPARASPPASPPPSRWQASPPLAAWPLELERPSPAPASSWSGRRGTEADGGRGGGGGRPGSTQENDTGVGGQAKRSISLPSGHEFPALHAMPNEVLQFAEDPPESEKMANEEEEEEEEALEAEEHQEEACAGDERGGIAVPKLDLARVPESASSPLVQSPSKTTNLKVSVCVRKRPLQRKELEQKDRDIVSVRGQDTIEVHEPKTKVDLTKYTEVHQFVFDHSFSEHDDNMHVYERTAKPLVANVFHRGARVTCFCYGQTGSGKTHTMMGKKDIDGLYALAAKDIFQLLKTEYAANNLLVSVSLFEIYGNKLFDLLNERKKIVARQNAKQEVSLVCIEPTHRDKVCIVGLTERVVESADQLLSFITRGNQIRATAATGVHSESSRSHAILQISTKNQGRTQGMFSFIDLAGSEKGNSTSENDKQTRIEGAEINKSLLALKECIRALDRSQKHAPFRQSTLTQVLKDSFVGRNSRTVMIANIGPSSASAEHTLNTLRYADRVRELRGTLRPSSTALSPRSTSSEKLPRPESRSSKASPSAKENPRQGKAVSKRGASKSQGVLKELMMWHREHLGGLHALAQEEAGLLEEAAGGRVGLAEYKELLNDILVRQALLYANIPKALD